MAPPAPDGAAVLDVGHTSTSASASSDAPLKAAPGDPHDGQQQPGGFFARMRAKKAAAAAEKDAASGSAGDDGPPPIPFLQLWRYTNRTEKAYVLVGCIAAAIHGALLPLWTIFFGDVITAFGENGADEVVSQVSDSAKYFFILGAIAFVMSFIQVRFQMVVANRTSIRMRKLYFRSLMRQDPAWYDAENSGELTSRVASDVDLIQAGMGDKVGSAVQFLAMAATGFIVSFAYTWKLTLVILSTTPVLAICGGVFAKLTADSTSDGQGAYGSAGGVASEVISLIRTVHAFGGQEEEARRYEKNLGHAYKAGVAKGITNGFGMGVTMFLIFCTYALSFWFGARLIRSGEISVTDVFVAFFSVLMGSMGLGQAAPSFQAFSVARGAAPRVYEVIDRASTIDALSEDGDVLDNVSGTVSFENMTFNYASREAEGSTPVLRNLNLTVHAGTTHALVGASGCGKSSTMGLIERFYDPQIGVVRLDGIDIRTLNVRWLRAQMGYVGQMPTLFRGTIRENISFGAAVDFDVKPVDGERSFTRCEVTEEEIVAAAKLANAHNFISKLPEGYDTKLGERGALLSGGQKQRICIARAIVRNPKILLLDEATSALDSQSERIVQDALERAAAGRTTILIAHRLSTVRNADVISVFKNGEVAESGSHDDLVQHDGGVYRELVELQQVHAVKAEEKERASDVEDPDALPPQTAAAAASASKTGVDSTDVALGEKVSEDEDERPDVDAGVIGRTFKVNAAETGYVILGCLGAALAGASWPISAFVFSKVTSILAQPDNEDDVRFWSLMFIVVGAGSLIGNACQMGFLGISGERLTQKLRSQSFRAILRQEMGFFDREENSVGALTTRLATEASQVKGLSGDTLGMIAVTMSTIGAGLGVSFAGCWRLALVVLCMLPIMAAGGFIQMKMMTGFDAGSKKEFVGAGSVASEAVDNVRTITGLGIQDTFMDRYEDALVEPKRNGNKAANVSGLAFGFSEAFMFAMWAIAFLVGAKFIEKEQCDFEGLMMAVTGLLFAGITLGNVSVFAPDVASSKVSATKIFRLLDRQTEIDPTDPGGQQLASASGAVAAKGVQFEYPTRPDVAVLRGLNVAVAPGKTLALCGQSGCGKSTLVALLERFYDIREGSLTVDDKELSELNVQNARSHMALVQQEPDLFNRTVKENIAYGLCKEEGTPVTDEMIVNAAKAANAHDFITGDLPLGYDTPVGERGGAMSGGMKQRIAIARALVREPRVLLLDEATSALDARSERVVQDALDTARQGRTTIVIAHRLSTIKDADAIAVVASGKITEIGTHADLMAKNGVYAELVKYQVTEEPL